ncbi:hypothetical protein HPB49_020509 [Dermacentor silvarum]|uniref:Uncharacterized protein n=1 Tax=Dermacentor silvarum TaxID=543639 RepID=A0ACB8E377_DERSI|nr:hypothetical protein HPB49_020509 [Dermacentor silvarum]
MLVCLLLPLFLESSFSVLADKTNVCSCEERIWYCSFSPCQNGATCLDGEPGHFSCQCTDDFEGQNCTDRLQHGRFNAKLVRIVCKRKTKGKRNSGSPNVNHYEN